MSILVNPPERYRDRREQKIRSLLKHASVEVTARFPVDLAHLRAHFALGTDVHVTFLPNDDCRKIIAVASQLRNAGFNPVPHLPARSFPSLARLDDYLARAVGEAGVARVLLIAGDVDQPRGPFNASMDIMQTGLLQKRGIRSIAIAGHPEGHPTVSAQAMASALAAKIQFAREHGFGVKIVTQFCFEAAPILSWLRAVRQAGIDAPVRIGAAGPASVTSLLKFGLRCGVGNSLRALRRQSQRIGQLMGDVGPDSVLSDITNSLNNAEIDGVEGVHFFVFGGLRKTGEWYRLALSSPMEMHGQGDG